MDTGSLNRRIARLQEGVQELLRTQEQQPMGRVVIYDPALPQPELPRAGVIIWIPDNGRDKHAL